MFQVLHRQVANDVSLHASAILGSDAAVLDWAGLGVHTGSRLAEYAQSKKPPGALFAMIPKTAAAGRWAGQALAFILEDFTFYNARRVRLSITAVVHDQSLAMEIHVHFYFDKASDNFVICKFGRVSNTFLCPVRRAASIVSRAVSLGVPPHFPIGVYRNDSSGSFHFLDGNIIQNTMHAACIIAYPDPNHYMRIHLDRLVTHSNRVTACVALKNAGVDIDDIAFRVCWSPESICFYTRDCFKTIGPFTEMAIIGATQSYY